MGFVIDSNMVKGVPVNLGLLGGCFGRSQNSSRNGILLFTPSCKFKALMNSSRGLVTINVHMYSRL